MLIRNTEQFAQFTSIAKSMPWEKLRPEIKIAEEKYIKPLIGLEFYNTLDQAITDDDLEVPEKLILEDIQACLAKYTMVTLRPTLLSMSSSTGNQEMTDSEGTHTPVRQWAFNAQQSADLEAADQLAESLLVSLELNATNFPTWANSDAFTQSRELFFTNSSQLSAIIPIAGKRTFIALKPMLTAAQEAIESVLTTPLFEDLLEKFQGNDELNATEEKLLKLVRTVIANDAACRALELMVCRINAGQITSSNFTDGMTTVSKAEDNDRRTAFMAYKGNLAAAIAKLEIFLEANKSTLTLYVQPEVRNVDKELINSKGGLFL
jgi:hypothetical protein